jgi:hypothetical protein
MTDGESTSSPLGGGIDRDSPLDRFYSSELENWSRSPGDLLYHYTTSNGIAGIFKSRSVWATHSGFLNDSSEMLYGEKLILEVLDERAEHTKFPLLKEMLRDGPGGMLMLNGKLVPFVTSFCECGDQLSQWRGYGDEGQGFSLGFDLSALAKVDHGPLFLRKVVYNRSEQIGELTRLVNDWIDVSEPLLSGEGDLRKVTFQCKWTLRSCLLEHQLSYKDSAFEEEREWRLMKIVLLDNIEGMAKVGTSPTILIEEIDRRLEFEPDNEALRKEKQLWIDELNYIEQIQFRNGKYGLIPYTTLQLRGIADDLVDKFPVRSVIVGPFPYQAVQVVAANLLQSLNPDFPVVRVTPSSIPYR